MNCSLISGLCRPAALLLAALASGCALNPATGEHDFVLMSEDREIALGRESHAEVLKQYRRYDDPALQAYVQDIGTKVATASHRANLIYRFTVLDSPEVNAFALPGGYIYITRGLMAYLGSEAELAAVLGHEIGHVTARHSVRRHSTAMVTGVVGTVIAAQTGVRGAQDLANVLGTALVRGYGREHELEADALGAEYLARSGYDPRAMLNVIRVLKDQELFEKQLAEQEQREPRIYHGLFSTHPDNDKRLREVINRATALSKAGPAAPDDASYLRAIEGLVFGDSEADGIRRGSRFYHRELNFAMHFPDGWRVDNLKDRLAARPPGNDAILQLTTTDRNRRITPREFMLQRLELSELSHEAPFPHGGLQGHTAVARARTPYGTRPVRFVVIYHADRAYVLAGAARDDDQPLRYDSEFVAAGRSFHPLRPEEMVLARALRIGLTTAGSDTHYAALASGSRIPNHPEPQLRLLNGHYPAGEPAAGELLKIVD